ncbi:hypothetical protein [Acetilactobacillus jinshanensis]|nr:hypothetical protein [Acetilactobacillus jinshanensis]URL61387.1 hypothetical protein HGK75_05200 [uncultured bacterium]
MTKIKKNQKRKLTADQVLRKMKRSQSKCTNDSHHRHCYCYRNHVK